MFLSWVCLKIVCPTILLVRHLILYPCHFRGVPIFHSHWMRFTGASDSVPKNTASEANSGVAGGHGRELVARKSQELVDI